MNIWTWCLHLINCLCEGNGSYGREGVQHFLWKSSFVIMWVDDWLHLRENVKNSIRELLTSTNIWKLKKRSSVKTAMVSLPTLTWKSFLMKLCVLFLSFYQCALSVFLSCGMEVKEWFLCTMEWDQASIPEPPAFTIFSDLLKFSKPLLL